MGQIDYYESAVDEVARLRAAHAHRDQTGYTVPDYGGSYDDDQLQAGIARSLADNDGDQDGRFGFGSSRPKGLVDVLRAVANSLAGINRGGYDDTPLR